MFSRLTAPLAFAGVAALSTASIYILYPLRGTGIGFLLVVGAAAVLRAQFVLLVAWACLTEISSLLRVLLLFIAPVLFAVADTTLLLGRPFNLDQLILLYLYGLVIQTALGAMLTFMRRQGLRLRGAPGNHEPQRSQLSLRALFSIVTASALVMMLANLLRIRTRDGVYLALALGFIAAVAVSKIAAIWIVLWATLWRGDAIWRIALALSFVAGVEYLQWYVVGADASVQELVVVTLTGTFPSVLVVAALLVVRKRGYRLGWFEPSPRQRIVARRQELQSVLDQYAATGEIEWGEPGKS